MLTDEGSRNIKHLSKDYLEKIQRLAVMNSLNITKITMYGDKAIVKVSKELSMSVLPAFDVDKK